MRRATVLVAAALLATLAAWADGQLTADVPITNGATVDNYYPTTNFQGLRNGFIYMQNNTGAGDRAWPVVNFDLSASLTAAPGGFSTTSTCAYSTTLRMFPMNDCCMRRAQINYSGCCVNNVYANVAPACADFWNADPNASNLASLNFIRVSSTWQTAANIGITSATWNNVYSSGCGGSSANSYARSCYAPLEEYATTGKYTKDVNTKNTYFVYPGEGNMDCSSYSSAGNALYTVQIDSRLANNAIRGVGTTAGQLSFYMKAYTSSSANYFTAWLTRGAPDNADIILRTTYFNCVAGATCTQSGISASCVCSGAYVLGDGTTSGTGCQSPVACPAYTYNGYSFPLAQPGTSSTASCGSGYTGTVTMSCDAYGSGPLAPSTSTNGFVTATFVSQCARVSCPADNSGSVGNAVWSAVQWGAAPVTAQACASGYVGGLPTRLCNSPGVWAGSISGGTACSLATCAGTTYGGVTFSVTNAGTTGSGPCPSGYSGSATMSCVGGSTGWNTATFSMTSCVINTCPAQTGNSATGAATYQLTNAFATANGLCPTNWAGAPSRTCGASGSWSADSNPCTRVVCSAITGDSNTGAPSYPQTNAGSSGPGTCPTSWFFGSAFTRSCSSPGTAPGTTGVWSSDQSPCTRIQCPLLTNDATTSASWPATNTGSIAPGTCSVGYNGSPTRVCNNPASGGVGDWSATINNPCVIQTCASTSDATSLATYQQTNAFVTVVGSCNTGYAGAPTRACNGGVGAASWATSYGGTACTAITCPVLSNDNNADWPVTSLAGVSSKTVQGTCRTGYSSVATQPQRTCAVSGSTGAWGATITYPCLQNTCAQLANDGNAVWNATLVNVNSPFTITVTGTCRPGYTGTVSRVCSIDGTWGVISGTCNQIFCQPFYSSGDRATYPTISAGTNNVPGQCDATYAGVPRRNCKIDGTWDTTSAVGGTACTPATCPPLANDYDASWPQGTVNQAASGTCLPGFYTGAPQRLCNADGSWSSTITGTPCTAVVCNINDQSGNAVWPATVQTGTTATATGCATGFYSSGQLPTRACLADGVLGTVSGGCLQTYCAALYLDNNANWTQAVAGSTSAPGTCIAGWTGAPTRSCSTSGIWGATVNNPCIQRTCAAQIDTVNRASFPDGTPAGDPTPVSGMCNAGWAGSPTKLCPIAGVFGNTLYSGSCTQLFCQALTDDFNAAWEATAAGLSAGGTCLAGFGGTTSRTCSITGVWQDPPDGQRCQQLVCAGFSTQSVTVPAANSGSNAVGTCADGWTFSDGGPPSIACPLGTGSVAYNQASLANPCVRLTCGAYNTTKLSFPQANAGTSQVEGSCQAGYAVNGGNGTPKRDCNINGVWDTLSVDCEQLFCVSVLEDNAQWPQVPAGAAAIGVCREGFRGSPQRTCSLSGTYDTAISSPCEMLYCPATTEGSANWPQTQALGQTIQVDCPPTFSGNPYRVCNLTGEWTEITGVCTPIVCLTSGSNTVADATWPTTRAGVVANGTCVSGFIGSPTRPCTDNGWGEVSSPCQLIVPPCREDTYDNAVWPETAPGTVVNGTCNQGYLPVGGRRPSRVCSPSGVWSGSVDGTCRFTALPSGGRVFNLTTASVTDASITLKWKAAADTNMYLMRLSADGSSFQTITNGVLNITTSTARGLQQFTTYYFIVVAGTDSVYDDFGGQLIVTTAISPPSGLQISNVTASGFRLLWSAASPSFADWYLVTVTSLGPSEVGSGSGGNADLGSGRRRAAVGVEEVLGNITAGGSTGTFLVSNLLPSTQYEVKIRGGRDGMAEPTGVSQTIATVATQEQTVGGTTTYVAVGVSVGVILLILIIAAVLFVLYRRRQTTQRKKILEDFGTGSQLGLIAMNQPGAIPNNIMIGSYQNDGDNGQTQMIGGDATMINTVMEVALPGFLRLNYTTDLRPEMRLTAGGAGTIFRAMLLDNQLAVRHGTIEVALKQVADWPAMSEEDNSDRFHQEVSIMWSLSFHPNIIKMIGYTDEPRTIVTRLYPTDLFRFLHAQADKTRLPTGLALHLCQGMMAGLAAIHSLGIAHRDIKSPNVLLSEPATGSYPDPVICDFGLSRTGEEALKKFAIINGFSPKYAPPEIFARVHIKGVTTTVSDDQASDIYSMGVVLWETLSRQIPWEDTPGEEIELIVRGGGRVPPLQIDDNNEVEVMVNAIVNASLQQAPERRPTAQGINTKLFEMHNKLQVGI